MGCIWSHEPSEYGAYDGRANISRSTQGFSHRETYVKPTPQFRPRQTKPHALFGEYKCSACGRIWQSRLSWPNSYQVCRRCKKPVYPFNQRELRPSDVTKSKSGIQEHNKDLCQMCQQLGYYCGKFVQTT